MLSKLSLIAAAALTANAVEIQAEVEQFATSDTDPCPFPDTKQFNTPEYLA